jgi:signal transduction histidine kinase
MQDGVFTSKPNSIAQTSDGYLWIGTGGGLLRFDGIRFFPWTPPEGEKLPDSLIWSLLAARDGTLWIGTRGGLSHMVNGHLINYPDTRATVPSIVQSRNGTLWITRAHVRPDDRDGPLCKVIGARLRCFGPREGIPDVDADPMAEDRRGNIWIGGTAALTEWRSGSAINYGPDGIRPAVSLESMQAISPAADGSMWIGMVRSGPGLGLQNLLDGVWKPLVLPGFDSSTLKVASLFLDAANALWIGTMDKGIYRVHDRQVEHFGALDGLSSDAVYNFFQDREGDLWAITSEGIDRFRSFPITTFSIREGLSAAKAGSVVAARDGSIWTGNYYAVDVLRGRQISSLGPREGLQGQKVTSLLEDRHGRMWVGIDDRLAIYEKPSFRRVDLPGGKPIGPVGGMTEDSAENVWVVTDTSFTGNLFRVRNFEIQKQTFASGFPGVYSLASDLKGDIWLGLRNGDLAKYSGGELATYPQIHGSGFSPLRCLSTTRNGSILGIHRDGLLEFREGTSKILGTKNGLPCDFIDSFVSDRHGNLYLYMTCGVVAISGSELERWWKTPSTKIAFQQFDAIDGARTDRSYFSPASAVSPDGRLWFASSRVLQMIDPANLHLNALAPPVHIEQISTGKDRRSPIEDMSLPPRTRDIEIDYTGLSFVVPERVRFRYRMEGHDQGWQDAGSRRSAFYTNLSPGTYTFHVIAANNDGVWNNQGAELRFHIIAAWYQTRSFQLLALLAGLSLCYFFYRIRMTQYAASMKVRFDERLEERTRLARDLHDTLLQTIQGSRLAAEHARKNVHDVAETRRALHRLSEWLERATNEGRAAVESLRESITEHEDLLRSLRVAAEECGVKAAMESNVRLIGEHRDIHPIVKSEVYRIAFEAIHNACVHSGGNRLSVELEYSQDLTLKVRDDGVGIDPQVLRDGAPGHFGLVGMRERATQIGSTLLIRNLPHGGTELVLLVPGRIVFRRRPGTARFFKLRV